MCGRSSLMCILVILNVFEIKNGYFPINIVIACIIKRYRNNNEFLTTLGNIIKTFFFDLCVSQNGDCWQQNILPLLIVIDELHGVTFPTCKLYSFMPLDMKKM